MSGTRILGTAALALGVAAPFAGAPTVAGAINMPALAHMVATRQDHVPAVEVARWIRDRKPGLRLIDVRSPEEFAQFALPTAENLPIESIPDARFSDDEIVVLYSEGGAHAAQAWVFLKAGGVRNVVFIAGGLADWFDEVIHPLLPAEPSAGEAGRIAELVELSAYFGGTPREAVPGEAATVAAPESGVSALIANARRRGC